MTHSPPLPAVPLSGPNLSRTFLSRRLKRICSSARREASHALCKTLAHVLLDKDRVPARVTAVGNEIHLAAAPLYLPYEYTPSNGFREELTRPILVIKGDTINLNLDSVDDSDLVKVHLALSSVERLYNLCEFPMQVVARIIPPPLVHVAPRVGARRGRQRSR